VIGQLLGQTLLEGVLGPILHPILNRIGRPVSRLVTTPVLIASWLGGAIAFGFGCYLLAVGETVLAVGTGAVCLLGGLPTALVATAVWRDNRPGRLGTPTRPRLRSE
jgi:hypothetical protein